MDDLITHYRLYADGSVVHQDDFTEIAHASPYYDDFQIISLPDALVAFIAESYR